MKQIAGARACNVCEELSGTTLSSWLGVMQVPWERESPNVSPGVDPSVSQLVIQFVSQLVSQFVSRLVVPPPSPTSLS